MSDRRSRAIRKVQQLTRREDRKTWAWFARCMNRGGFRWRTSHAWAVLRGRASTDLNKAFRKCSE